MRNEHTILADLTKAKEKHHKTKMTEKESRASSDKIEALLKELNACLTQGAKPKPGGVGQIIGIRRQGKITGIEISHFGWAKGTKPVIARGATKEEAVENWNKGIFIN